MLIALGIMNFCPSLVKAMETLPMEMTPRATPGENWNLEIKNKYGEDVMVGIRYADGKKEQINKARLLHNGDVLRFATINTYRQILIAIWTQGQFGDNPAHAQNKEPLFTYVIDAGGNTIFVALDENGNLYPQRGEFLGITGKTQSGLLKTSNVQKKDISLTAAIGKRIIEKEK